MRNSDGDGDDAIEQADIMAGDRRIARADSALPDSIVPDASYRPVPIAWFAATFLLQMVTLTVLFVTLLTASGWLTIVFAGAATLGLGAWTWDRGMKTASAGWRIATVLMLAFQFGFVCLGVAARQ